MTENGQPPLNHNHLNPDAATWTAANRPWDNPAPGTLLAVLLGQNGARVVEISREDTTATLSRLVGDPLFDCVRLTTGVDLWVGHSSLVTSPINPGASLVVTKLLRDVVSGEYPASDNDQAHAGDLIDSDRPLTQIHGPALITGVDPNGDITTLPASFQDWYDRLSAPFPPDQIILIFLGDE